MALFGIGASSARSNSQSSSLDFGANVSQSFSDSLARAVSESMSRGSSSSFGQSTGVGSSLSTQNVWNADVLQQLYKGALGAVPDTSLFSGEAADLFKSGTSFLDQLGVGAGEDYLSARLSDTSGRDAQLGALSSGLGALFRDELNPAITSHAVATGTLGGGRQGVAQGIAAGKIAQQYQQGAADIISKDQLARDTAAGQLGQLGIARASTGFAGLDSLLGIASAGLNGSLAPYSTLSQIFGGPLALTTAISSQQQQSTDTASALNEASSSSSSEEIARAISQALGFNYGTSESTSKSKSNSFNFGFG